MARGRESLARGQPVTRTHVPVDGMAIAGNNAPVTADEGESTVPRLARELGVSDQTLRDAVDRGEIPSHRNARGHRMIRREDIPEEWAPGVRARRAARWGTDDTNGHEALPSAPAQAPQLLHQPPPQSVMRSEVAFLREQSRVKDETIQRLLTLLETRLSSR